jgi:uncharacterized membrane protein (DUF4010 family)
MVSCLRVLTIVAIIKPELALAIAAPALAAGLVFAAFGAGLLWRASPAAAQAKLGNPFDLVPLLIFAVSFAVVAAASAALTQRVGAGGVIVTSGLSGFVDVDVAALSAARLAGNTIPVTTAAAGVLVAIALNAVARVIAACAVGPWRYSALLAAATVLAAAAGGLVFALPT